VLLLLGAGEGHPVANGWFVKGGPGALADALASAARQAGVEIRTNAEVAQIDVADGGAAGGVTLASGERIAARAVASNADPKRTLLGLVDPMHLEPEFVRRLQNIRARHSGEGELRRRRCLDSPARRRTTPRPFRDESGWRATSTASSAPSTPRSTAALSPSRGSS
jgi:phytoene dehydrogenase-like protein